MSSSPLARWEKLGSEVKLTTRVFEVAATKFRHGPRGTTREFSVIHSPDWVNVIALTQDGQLVLVRQFRYGIDEFSLEIPGGVMEAGENPVVAGARELEEETGYTGPKSRLLGSVRPNPAIQSNHCHFVLLEDVKLTHDLAWDEDEEIEVVTLPVDEVYRLARSGKIVHSLVLDALFFFEPIWQEMKKR